MTDVIRNGINYGNLVINELDGVQFATDAFYAEMLDLLSIDTDVIPEFNLQLHISTILTTTGRESLHYVFNNADVRKVAVALSRHSGLTVRVYSHARILAVYKNGELEGDIRPLASFYSNLTQEQIAASTF